MVTIDELEELSTLVQALRNDMVRFDRITDGTSFTIQHPISGREITVPGSQQDRNRVENEMDQAQADLETLVNSIDFTQTEFPGGPGPP